ncbi:MAG: HNH endonuclease [Ureaplasma sp.]|nr:HNH endonuclease [Ureaplasma sp.]
MAKFKYSNEIEILWDKARYCYCGFEDCNPNNHRLCGICGNKILYGSHESVTSQINSQYAWNIDHIRPISRGGKNNIDNKQAVHIYCNRQKSNKW